VLEASDESSRALKPGEEALDMPASFVAAEGTCILSLGDATRVMRSDHLDTHGFELRIEEVAVVSAVSDESLRQLFQESSAEGFDDELRFMALTTRNPDGDRKTMAVCHRHDLGRFAASSFPNKRAPFFAPA
jgi:hypothetical protein